MSIAHPALPLAGAPLDRPLLSPAVVELAATLLLAAAIGFNAMLAIVNGHGVGLSNGSVTLVQGAIIGAVLGLVALARPPHAARWWVLLWAFLLLFLLLSLARDRMDVRAFGDMGLIFAFIMLGLCIRPVALARLLIVLQLVITALGVWELASPGSYGQTFKVENYYIATRGFQEKSFYSGQTELFVSAERPGGRLLLPSLNIHRGSSIFLEPVSLGNWTIVATLATAALWRWLSWRAIAMLAGTNLVLLVACDGRLALMTNILLLPFLIVGRRVPRWVPPLTLPGMLLALALAQALGLLNVVGDTFVGRLTYSMNYLETLDFQALMGVPHGAGITGADSGWSYLAASQSLPGLVALWLALTLPIGVDTPQRRRFVLGMAIFLTLALPISYSVFSIKIAAFLWATYGCVQRSGDDGEARPRHAPAGPGA